MRRKNETGFSHDNSRDAKSAVMVKAKVLNNFGIPTLKGCGSKDDFSFWVERLRNITNQFLSVDAACAQPLSRVKHRLHKPSSDKVARGSSIRTL
jgi:hypothetical protein